jgi:hypothetical protein
MDRVFNWLVNADNYRAMPGVLRVKVHRIDGDEPNGVGALRELTNLAMKVTEEVTVFERPHRMSYVFRSAIPPMQHEGATMSFCELAGRTEVSWTTTLQLSTPVLGRLVTPAYLWSLGLGMKVLFRAAERDLARE